jgi:hypothetical protein
VVNKKNTFVVEDHGFVEVVLVALLIAMKEI